MATNQISNMKDKSLEFEPAEDIDVHELATILKLARLDFANRYVEELPEKVRRHFK
jgi:hypothetical protein